MFTIHILNSEWLRSATKRSKKKKTKNGENLTKQTKQTLYTHIVSKYIVYLQNAKPKSLYRANGTLMNWIFKYSKSNIDIDMQELFEQENRGMDDDELNSTQEEFIFFS